MKVIKDAEVILDHIDSFYGEPKPSYPSYDGVILFSFEDIEFITSLSSHVEYDRLEYIKRKFIRDYIQGYML